MKVAWFSPRTPERSGIAQYTEMLAPELRRCFDVRFLTEKPDGFHEPEAGRVFPTPLGQVPPGLVAALNDEDVPIYNLGNHPAFFSHTWFLSQCKPGIVILHDLKLHHFFEGIYRERLHDQPRYLAWMEEYHGLAGLEAGRLYWLQKILIGFMAEHFPMTAWGVRNALAVVVHTPHALGVIKRETTLPACLNPLPHETRMPPADAASAETRRGRSHFSSENRARLAIFGFLNVNRRVLEFLRAWAGMEERACFEVHFFGELLQTYEQEVRREVETLGLQAQACFHGYVSEEELDAGLTRCDLAVNLRYPTMGEASASQLRIWDHALPSLVTRIDGYATLPADAVGFVRPDHEREDIQRRLRDFLTHPESHHLQGERGRQVLLDQHHPAAYVDRLSGLCRRLPELRSRPTRLRMAERLGRAIAPWWDPASTTPREEFLAGSIAAMF